MVAITFVFSFCLEVDQWFWQTIRFPSSDVTDRVGTKAEKGLG